MAVAKVLAAYVARHPTATRGFGIEGRNIKDTVVYALRGERLSRETLELFIGAFSIKDEDAAHLWKQWEGAERAPAVIGNLELPHDVSGYRTPMHNTVMLYEHHWLGPDGSPARHRSQISIRSRVDGLVSYQYRFDTPHARVSVKCGGHAGKLYEVGGGLWATDLRFPRPLRRDEVHYMEFWTLLKYDMPPAPEILSTARKSRARRESRSTRTVSPR